MIQYPELNAEQIRKIRLLERELGDVCLLAVRRAEAMFAVEAKTGRNQWDPIHEVYPEIEGLRSFYLSRDDAQKAKNSLKSFLLSKAGKRFKKQPIRVVRIAGPPDEKDAEEPTSKESGLSGDG